MSLSDCLYTCKSTNNHFHHNLRHTTWIATASGRIRLLSAACLWAMLCNFSVVDLTYIVCPVLHVDVVHYFRGSCTSFWVKTARLARFRLVIWTILQQRYLRNDRGCRRLLSSRAWKDAMDLQENRDTFWNFPSGGIILCIIEIWGRS